MKTTMAKKIISTLVFFAIFVIIVNVVTHLLISGASSSERTQYSVQSENTIDVILAGPSTMLVGISPMLLYEEYGIISYNISMGGQTIPMTYYNLAMALETQTPQIVIMDICYFFCNTTIDVKQPQRLHQLLSSTDFSWKKLPAIFNIAEKSDWVDYIFPMAFYHELWKNLETPQAAYETKYQKGGKTYFHTISPKVLSNPFFVCDESEKISVNEYILSLEYTKKIIELCRENNITVVFTNLPSYTIGETTHGDGISLQKMWNGFADYAENEQLDYINYMHILDEIEFDFAEDMADWRHANYWGQQKLTSHLGRYIQNNYNIPDRRDDPDYSVWNEQYILYLEEIELLYVDFMKKQNK